MTAKRERPKLVWDPKAHATDGWAQAWNDEAREQCIPYRVKNVNGRCVLLKLVEVQP